uniref:Uncharacterized protein n=1 Tax=Romanomermis culicivorax TaxID=13658 RepID=A0A915IZH8_ROMCU
KDCCQIHVFRHGLTNQWYVFEDITGCHKVDHLSRCMTASALLVVVGLFLCVVNLANYALTLKALRGRPTVFGADDSYFRTGRNGSNQTTSTLAAGDFAHWVRHTRPSLATAALFLDFAPPPPPRYGEAVRRQAPAIPPNNDDDDRRRQSGSSSLAAPDSVDGAPPPYSKKDFCRKVAPADKTSSAPKLAVYFSQIGENNYMISEGTCSTIFQNPGAKKAYNLYHFFFLYLFNNS